MEHLTINQVAKELNCHPNTVRQHLADWGFLKW
ncbi:helix-turn-helix domain-containing protein [Mannheimia haemolytica]|nr:helix-turn-helix domain-containing protein [Mannheimia haemolytica]